MYQRSRVLQSVLWAGVLSAGVGVAQTNVSETAELPDLMVTANRYAVPASRVGSAVTVIDAAAIERSKQSSVLEILRAVPGLEVTQSGGPGRITDVSIRGGSSSQTLVLVDGVRVNSATLGAFDFAGLTADNIERIEVVRGPQSTLYGSEAMGGVINIITKKGAPGYGGSARVEGGSPGQWRGSVGVSGGEERFDYSLSASVERYDGLSAADESVGATEDDLYENIGLSARVGGAMLGDGRADLSVRGFSSDTDVDGFDGMLPADDLNATTEREGVAASLTTKKRLNAWWEQSVLVGIYDEQLTGKDPDSEFNRYTIDNQNLDLTAQSDLQTADNNILTAGYTFEARSGATAQAYDEDATVHAVFLQDQWMPADGLDLTGGARLDDHSEFGSESTYRGTASYLLPRTALRLHGSVGTGFKAPTFGDLFFPGFANPDLDPETSLGFDAGVETRVLGGRALLDATYFRTDYDDLISYDVTTFRAENIRKSNAQGVELSGRLAVSTNLLVGASYTYTDSEDEQTGDPLPRRPEHRATFSASYAPTARLSGTAALLLVNDRIDSDGQPMDDYERVDLTLEYAMNRHVYPYVRVENLLDQDYEEINGFSSPGFTGIGGVRAVW